MVNDLIMATDLDDLDEAEGGPQPVEGRELVIVNLRYATIMLPSWPEHRAAAGAMVLAPVAPPRPPAHRPRYQPRAHQGRAGAVDEQEVRELFFERLQHLSAEAEYDLRHPTM
jgi:hypothetical protein